MNTEFDRFRYRIDSHDRLIDVDQAWLAFAEENGARELTRSRILGKSLWTFVRGDTLVALYLGIHERVRKSGRPAVFLYRCDSPLLRRYMRMTISHEGSEELLYDTVIERAVPQRRLSLFDAELEHLDSSITICSCCKRALLDSVGWLDPEDFAFRTGLLEADVLPELRHDVCPTCNEVLRTTPFITGTVRKISTYGRRI